MFLFSCAKLKKTKQYYTSLYLFYMGLKSQSVEMHYFLQNTLFWNSSELQYKNQSRFRGSALFHRLLRLVFCWLNYVCPGFSLTYGFSEPVEKTCLITMVTTPPPPCACSREDLFTIPAPDSITCQSSELGPPLPARDWPSRWLRV